MTGRRSSARVALPSKHRPLRSLRLAVVLGLSACGGGEPAAPVAPPPVTPPPEGPGLRVLAGAGVTDTVDAQLVQALLVEVRGRDGATVAGTVVRFEAQPAADTARRAEAGIYVCSVSVPTCGLASGATAPTGSALPAQFTVDTTDARGTARALVRLGRVAGPARIRLVVPEFGLVDSSAFTVSPGRPARLRALAADTVVDVGASTSVRTRLVDRYGNERTDPTTVSLGATTSTSPPLAAGTGAGQFFARDMGGQWVVARAGALVDSTFVRVLPVARMSAWSPQSGSLVLVDLNGRNERTVLRGVSSDYGTFPRFDPTRQRLSLHYSGTLFSGGRSRVAMVVDTGGVSRRDVTHVDFGAIFVTRQLPDGTLLVLGQRPNVSTTVPGAVLWRVAPDNTVTVAAQIADLPAVYGGADISADGARIAYVTAVSIVGTTPRLRVLDVATGLATTIDNNAAAPRWSQQGERLAYLAAPEGSALSPAGEGALVVANADGTGRRTLASRGAVFSPGLSWSPDGTYIVGRDASTRGLRVVRVSDGADVSVRLGTDYFQPDWR